MSRKNTEKVNNDLIDKTICANESTGALQKITIDNDELLRYHREFNKDNEKES